MKSKSVLSVLLTVLSVLAVSCVDNLEPDDRLIIDPENVPMFQFDADGVPYRYESPTLSNTEYVSYFHLDAVNKDVSWQQACSFMPETGILDDLRIWSIYTLSGKWYMDCVEPLCQRNAGDGTYKTVWGCSHFVRMTNAELQQMQQTYIFDYSQHH